MTIAEEILAELQTLPEAQAREVLYFIALLKSRRQRGEPIQQDVSAFDCFGAIYEGEFRRDELYDGKYITSAKVSALTLRFRAHAVSCAECRALHSSLHRTKSGLFAFAGVSCVALSSRTTRP